MAIRPSTGDIEPSGSHIAFDMIGLMAAVDFFFTLPRSYITTLTYTLLLYLILLTDTYQSAM